MYKAGIHMMTAGYALTFVLIEIFRPLLISENDHMSRKLYDRISLVFYLTTANTATKPSMTPTEGEILI